MRLFTPGPTPVPQEVRDAGALPMIHHRSEDFTKILMAAREKLNALAGCDGETLLLSSSGSGGMEACVASLFSPGDEVVVVEGGKFGERWVELAKHYELKANVIHVEWGKAVAASDVLKAVTSTTKGVLMQACESSTGAYHPVAEVGRKLSDQPNVLLVVDAITALGVHDISMQRDGIDALVCGSQKALMCPPGLAMVSLRAKSFGRMAQIKSRSYYFSLQREMKSQTKGQTAFTPAISLIRSLHAALERIEKMGKEKWFDRQKKMQATTRKAVKEMGLELFNKDDEATWGITVVKAPSGLDVKAWLKELKTKHGLWLVGGQGELEGKIFRISHMGAIEPEELTEALQTIRDSLKSRS